MPVEGGGGEGREEEGEGRGDGDIQKKITRWANGVAVLDELGLQLPYTTDTANGGSGLVVVASLLNKIPNLGGSLWDISVVILMACIDFDYCQCSRHV